MNIRLVMYSFSGIENFLTEKTFLFINHSLKNLVREDGWVSRT